MENDPNEHPSDIDRQIRAIELKNEALDIVGGQMHSWEADDTDPAVAEQFWENVVAFESAPKGTLAGRLEEIGVSLPAADTLDEPSLYLKLWEMGGALAGLGVVLESTEHLSDRELYILLVSDLLREEATIMPASAGWTYHISPIGSGSEEDMQIHHRYYASEEERQSWLRQFPDEVLPAREPPRYERDARLQQLFEDR